MKGQRVLVTGGASFIGSHLVDKLLQMGAVVRVADDFSSGRLENLEYPLVETDSGEWTARDLQVIRMDLKDVHNAARAMEDIDVVFHLAARHGGRGYIQTHRAECCSNMALEQIVFEAANKSRVKRVCFASSACVYPSYLQEQTGSTYLLSEGDASPFERDKALPDLEYGWAKLMGEMSLKAYHEEYGLRTSSVRIFTAYGPRENETHAIIALIAKAFVKMDPYVIWGSGNQDRNFTYVTDIVEALILACERIDDASVVNAGRSDRVTINDAAELVFEALGWRPKTITHDTSKPQGVASRAADLQLAQSLLGWVPSVDYREGISRTAEWYKSNKDSEKVRENLQVLLFERQG